MANDEGIWEYELRHEAGVKIFHAEVHSGIFDRGFQAEVENS